jgi:diaminopimelate epimerase
MSTPVLLSGAGNTFGVLHAEDAPRDEAARAELAREVCAERDLDGLLLVGPWSGADARMIVLNADGTRPEACGNGLRCAAAFARATGVADSDRMRVETDAGLRSVELLRDGGGALRGARATMGEALVTEHVVEYGGALYPLVRVLLGNPHAALRVEDLAAPDLEDLAHAAAAHPAFEDGANVELWSPAGPSIAARVFERGVGETAACGTGACAVALAAERASVSSLPLVVRFPGGVLEVGRDEAGELLLSGPVEGADGIGG